MCGASITPWRVSEGKREESLPRVRSAKQEAGPSVVPGAEWSRPVFVVMARWVLTAHTCRLRLPCLAAPMGVLALSEVPYPHVCDL